MASVVGMVHRVAGQKRQGDKRKTETGPEDGTPPKLEVVLKCDSVGSLEAVTEVITKAAVRGVEIDIIHSGIGAVTQSDVLLAETASGLICGFQVDVVHGIEKLLREHQVEVRLYAVIYEMAEDIGGVAERILPDRGEEEIVGSAKVVALFKSSRKGIIIGCEILSGSFAVGRHFRIISAAGPVYSGVCESIHIGDHAVSKASPGERIGIKIKGFDKARIGDLVESFRPPPPKKADRWVPSGRIIRR